LAQAEQLLLVVELHILELLLLTIFPLLAATPVAPVILSVAQVEERDRLEVVLMGDCLGQSIGVEVAGKIIWVGAVLVLLPQINLVLNGAAEVVGLVAALQVVDQFLVAMVEVLVAALVVW
jgi:hypothetical protein